MRCLDIDGENRPTMREIAKNLNHPWMDEEHNYDETISLAGQQQEDLYPASSIGFNSSNTDFS
ncbi:Wall-associated receptor kinase 4 [Bienertia sinuspersici]